MCLDFSPAFPGEHPRLVGIFALPGHSEIQLPSKSLLPHRGDTAVIYVPKLGCYKFQLSGWWTEKKHGGSLPVLLMPSRRCVHHFYPILIGRNFIT